MTQKLYGEINGRHLDRFEVGRIYDVGTELGNYLLAIHAAEPARRSIAVRQLGPR